MTRAAHINYLIPQPLLLKEKGSRSCISQPHTLASVGNSTFNWDLNGNMIRHDNRQLCWDEENRLGSVRDPEHFAAYLYNAGGERVWKFTGGVAQMGQSGKTVIEQVMLSNKTLYASSFFVANDQGYTKHFFAGSERICSKIGGGLELAPVDPMGEGVEALYENHTEIAQHLYNLLHRFANCNPEPYVTAYIDMEPYLGGIQEWLNRHEPEENRFFYHPDLPIAIGIGARYYDATLSIWLSVDPMADKYPSMSAYMYCAGNPVMLVDPDGREIDEPVVSYQRTVQTTYTYVGEKNGNHIHRITETVTHRKTTMISDTERHIEQTTTITTTELRKSRYSEATSSTQSQHKTEFTQRGTTYKDNYGYSGTIWKEVNGSRKNHGGYQNRPIDKSRSSYNMRMQIGVLSDFIARNGYDSNYFQGDKHANLRNGLRYAACAGLFSREPYTSAISAAYLLLEYYKLNGNHSGRRMPLNEIKP